MKAEKSLPIFPSEGEIEKKNHILLFSLQGENYAIDLDVIEAILPYPFPTPVPKQPAFLEGFFEYENQCLPVVNLHRLLGVSNNPGGPMDKVLILRHAGFRMAVRVDGVLVAKERGEVLTAHDMALHDAETIEVDGKAYLLLKLDALLEGNATGAG